MINLLLAFQGDDHPIRLNQKFHLDLSWWHEFFHSWDGLSFLFTPIGLHYLIFLFPQMLPKPRVTAHPLTISGLWGNGQPLSCHYQLHTRSTSQWVPLSSPPFFAFAASHTASRDNFIADALSHFDFQGFHCLATHTAPVATSVLQSLLAQLPMT